MHESDIAALTGWYRRSRRDLPWRRDPTPYRVWVSEIMLQQTQVGTVLPYYGRFIARFPDVRSLAEASEAEVLELWAGLGYYSRARNLRRAALKIVEEHGGQFPRTLDEVMGLPGVGRYTAGAILSIAFNQAHPAVDGNVRRVIARLKAWRSPRPQRFFHEQAAAWIPRKHPSDFNQALMELGALVCVPVRPSCEICPLQSRCVARSLGILDRVPPAGAKGRYERVDLVILVVLRGTDALVWRQTRDSFIPGEWGLPTRPLADGEEPAELARRFARELLGFQDRFDASVRVTHAIVHRRITAHVYRIVVSARTGDSRFRWVPASIVATHLTSSLFRKALQAADFTDLP